MIVIPNYYRKFECLASNCRDTCCKGWNIYLDNKSEEMLIKFNKELDSNGQDNIIRINDISYIKFKEGLCPFFNCNRLCKLQDIGGVEFLPYSCRVYPRKTTTINNCTKYTLALSCEKSVALVLEYFDINELILENETFYYQNQMLIELSNMSNIHLIMIDNETVINCFNSMNITDLELLQILKRKKVNKGLTAKEKKILMCYYFWTYFDGHNSEITKKLSAYLVSIFDIFVSKTSNDFLNKIDIIHRLSREIEHCDRNINLIVIGGDNR